MAEKVVTDEQIRQGVRDGLSNCEIARRFGVSETTIRTRRKRMNLPASNAKNGREPEVPDTPILEDDIDLSENLLTKASYDFDFSTGEGELKNVIVQGTLHDWNHVFEFFELDPEQYEIVNDTISVSVWNQSARAKDGHRDIVKLRAYRAKFRKRRGEDDALFSEAYIADLIEAARGWALPKKPITRPGTPVAAVLNLSDMQLFKAEGGGVTATMGRLHNALAEFKHHVAEMRAIGCDLDELVIVNNGDPFEGIAGNYANQLHTVEGGLRAQMNAVLDVWLMFARELYPLFTKRQFVSVLCNHTQFGRQGGSKDSLTGDEDNGGAFLAETLKRILHATPGFEDVQFTIPHDEMNVYTEAAGVKLGFNHGHKIPKSDASGFEAWVNGQVRADRRAYDVRLWVTAHRHNLQLFDIGSATVLQCPSCDGGSKWLTDTTGKHANAGVVSILVGEHHRLGWSHLTFL